MRRDLLSSVAFPALPNFSTLNHKRRDFCLKKMLLNLKCVFCSVKLLSETFVILATIKRDDIVNVRRSSSDFEKRELSGRAFGKIL